MIRLSAWCDDEPPGQLTIRILRDPLPNWAAEGQEMCLPPYSAIALHESTIADGNPLWTEELRRDLRKHNVGWQLRSNECDDVPIAQCVC